MLLPDHQLSALRNHMFEFVSDHKQNLFNTIIQKRTRHLTIVLENLFQMHNASAVLRSADCFGIQDVHIIENYNTYEINSEIDMGASKWLNTYHYNEGENNTLECYKQLKEKGYRIVATTPHKDDCLMEELPLEEKTALVFGTELEGLTPDALKHADAYVKIPMHGFTESYNISVSAALSMYELSQRLHKSEIDWQLNSRQKEEILLEWAKRTVKHSELIEKRFLEQYR